MHVSMIFSSMNKCELVYRGNCGERSDHANDDLSNNNSHQVWDLGVSLNHAFIFRCGQHRIALLFQGINLFSTSFQLSRTKT
jgi:hypothetical protein